MLESNFEEIYLGMQFHNETEGPLAKEAKSIQCNNSQMWALESRLLSLNFHVKLPINI